MRVLILAALAASLTPSASAHAQGRADFSTADARQAHIRAAYSARPAEPFTMAIRASMGVAIPDDVIDGAVDNTDKIATGCFRVGQLVRVLFLTDKYDDRILPKLKTLPYWQTKNERKFVYLTENLMALWISSAYLMRQREGWAMDDQLDVRLHHFLDTKIKYGFHEYFSAVYLQRTLGALLNLADFATDPVIRGKAAQAASRLMREMVLLVNDSGAAFFATSRGYPGWYDKPQRPKTLFWVATGKGPAPTETFERLDGADDFAGQFVATTTVPLGPIGASRPESVDTTLRIGHPISESATVHAPLSRMDRTLFQMSAGGSIHPDTFADTAWLHRTMGLRLGQVPGLPPFMWTFPPSAYRWFATVFASFTRSMDMSQATVNVYRKAGSVLTSLEQNYGGYIGAQKWPWVATVGDQAVYTRSGLRGRAATAGFASTSNTHLPSVKQQSNVALITYSPNGDIPLFGFDTSVTLQWPAGIDQTVENGRWILGREGDSYVAVYRDDTTRDPDGTYFSARNDGRQGWAAVVGDKATHGSFDAFEAVVTASKVTFKESFDLRRFKRVVSARIEADGKIIEQTM